MVEGMKETSYEDKSVGNGLDKMSAHGEVWICSRNSVN